MSKIKSQKELIGEMGWNDLIILDAMRYDIFKEINTIPGDLQPVLSAGSWTPEWFRRTFPEPNYDIWMVSPSMTLTLGTDEKVEDKMKFDMVKGMSRGLRTCPAHFVTQQALSHIGERMIIHYMQPHFPAIGKTKMLFPLPVRGTPGSEPTAEQGVSRQLIIQAYKDNAKYVLEEVQGLLPMLDGSVVISADHGEYLGEGGRFGHEAESADPILRTVPWLEVAK
jgi:hypothetical protein